MPPPLDSASRPNSAPDRDVRLGPVDVGAAGKLATGPACVVASLARMTVWITNRWWWWLSCPEFVSFRFVSFHPRLLHADAVVMDRQGRGLLPRPPTALGLGLTAEVFKKKGTVELLLKKKKALRDFCGLFVNLALARGQRRRRGFLYYFLHSVVDATAAKFSHLPDSLQTRSERRDQG